LLYVGNGQPTGQQTYEREGENPQNKGYKVVVNRYTHKEVYTLIRTDELIGYVMLKKTASEIGRMIGVTRQAVAKRLRKLKREGLIEVDEAATLYRRQLKCSREIIYRVTDRGRIFLLNSDHSRGDDLRALKIRPLAGRHNVTFKIAHHGEGLLPAGYKKKRNFNNWTPHYGWYNDCYWETTPSNIIIKVKARARTEKEVWEQIYEKLGITWLFFKQLGWALDSEATMTYEGKSEVVGLIKSHEYEEGESAVIDKTPELVEGYSVIHPKNEGDADRIINMAHFIERNGPQLEDLPREIEMLRADIQNLTRAIQGEVYDYRKNEKSERPEIR